MVCLDIEADGEPVVVENCPIGDGEEVDAGRVPQELGARPLNEKAGLEDDAGGGAKAFRVGPLSIVVAAGTCDLNIEFCGGGNEFCALDVGAATEILKGRSADGDIIGTSPSVTKSGSSLVFVEGNPSSS